uniref:Uncharacterized protein n=1 Tax=Romanomermis culicivorax TaxID=13658 RepID=A0A915HQB2_ROMCU
MQNSSSFKDKLAARQTLANIEAKFRKKSNKVSTTNQQLMKKYEHEEENFLKNLEKLQKVRQQQQQQNDFGFVKVSKIPTSLKSQSLVLESSTSNKTNDLLGSFCQILQHVNRLRRENEHLKRQVVCFKEMRQMERIRQEKEENQQQILLCENCEKEFKKKNNKSLSIKPPQTNVFQIEKIGCTLVDKSSKKIGLYATCHESNLSTKTTTTGNNGKFVVADYATAANDASLSSWYSCPKNKNKNLLLSTSGNDDASSSNGNILRNELGQQQTDDAEFKSKIVTASKISISIESASERSSPSTNTTTTTATSKTPEDPSVDVNSAASSPALMSRSFSAYNNNRQSSKNGSSGAGQFLTIPKRSIFRSYGLRSSNSRSIKFSAEEAMIEPGDMVNSQLLTNQTFATSADFSADSVFSLLETTASMNNNSISNNISECLLVANDESSSPDQKNNDEDDDKVSIFAEVQLPDLKSESRQKRLRTLMTNEEFSTVETESFRSTANLTNGLSAPKSKCLSYTSSLLEKFGLRGISKHRSDITATSVNSSCASNPPQLCQSFVYAPSSKIRKENQGELMAKAIVRKRKRKISETDSIASSADESDNPPAAPEKYPKQFDTNADTCELKYQGNFNREKAESQNGNAVHPGSAEILEISPNEKHFFHHGTKAKCMFFSGELPKIEFQDSE